MEKVTVVKVGGAIVEDSEKLAQLLKDFAAIPGKKVLVHGGSPWILFVVQLRGQCCWQA